jgi:hypothetical protein
MLEFGVESKKSNKIEKKIGKIAVMLNHFKIIE